MGKAMKHSPYQIIIMRTTGNKPILTIGPLMFKAFFTIAIVIMIALIVVSYLLINSNKENHTLISKIASQAKDIRELNVVVIRKEEKIISLKKHMAPAIGGQRIVIKDVSPTPKVFPPIVEVTGLELTNNVVKLRIVNIKPGIIVSGYFFAVFNKAKHSISYPHVELADGIPRIAAKGLPFTIRNYKPMEFNIPKNIVGWDKVTLYVFDIGGKLRLVMPIAREEVETK